MPGHVGGRGVAEQFRELASLDLSEVPGLDDLHAANGPIDEARHLLAEAYGAGASYFLVNGATSGIHSLFMGLPDQATVLVPRNAHRSFFGGMVLSGARPVYIPVEIHSELGIGLAVTTRNLETQLTAHPEADAVFVTSPSYYGTTCYTKELADLAHQHNLPLYIDEAHGGHFLFHPDYPRSGIQAGADAVVNGLHKTLPVLNQGGCLHLSRQEAKEGQVTIAYSLLTTTSPSYPILASIDLARRLMVEQGRDLLEKARLFAGKYRKKINDIAGLHCYTEEEMRLSSGVEALDPLKLVISVQGLAINGYETASLLREGYRVQVEAQDAGSILAMMSIFHRESEWETFYHSLRKIAATFSGLRAESVNIAVPPLPSVVLSPRQAFYSKKHRVPLSQAVGKVAGEMAAAYPPGIPCLLPGEIITSEIYEYLCYLKNSPVKLQGPSQPELDSILVIEQPGKAPKKGTPTHA